MIKWTILFIIENDWFINPLVAWGLFRTLVFQIQKHIISIINKN